MVMFAGAKPLLLGVLLCFGVSLWLEAECLQVIYQRSTIHHKEGDKLRLNCTVTYNLKKCTDLEAVWYKGYNSDNQVGLTDPSKYFNVVSETDMGDDGNRSRQVTLEFVNLTLNDTGYFQCSAACHSSSQTAMGHFIQLDVKETDPNTLKASNYSSGIHHMNLLSAAVCCLVLMLFLLCVL